MEPLKSCRHPSGALLALACVIALPLWASEPVPTVIVDIHAIGADGLQRLKSDPSVRWSAEFGNELLLGISPDSAKRWLRTDRAREGLGLLSSEEIWVRDHVCEHEAPQPALGVVGGYQIVRQSASAISHAQHIGITGIALPADGVIAREQLNNANQKVAASPVSAIANIVAQVDADRWFATMSLLAGFNRNSFSPALGAARDWILSAFEGAGLPTTIFTYTLANVSSCSPLPPPIDITNPIGTKIGQLLPDEWIVVGAHYDSRNAARCDGSVSPQPGANDNASGCAGVIELARAFANVPTERSVLFMCFSGEEQGLWGSLRYVEALQANGQISRVQHMINLDMIGYDASGPLDARVETTQPHAAALAQYVSAAATYAPELNLITSSNTGGGSDHWYFLGAGIPAVFTWENGAASYPHYHRDTDLPQNMTRARELAGGILKMDAAVLAQLAGVSSLFSDGFE